MPLAALQLVNVCVRVGICHSGQGALPCQPWLPLPSMAIYRFTLTQ
jgi:hypothetical protein